MLIPKPKQKQEAPLQLTLTQQQYIDTKLLPLEQVKKFTGEFTELLHEEAVKEAREPEPELLLKNVFDALHTHNVMKLLQYIHGVEDRSRIFYALKKQLLATEEKTVYDSKEKRDKTYRLMKHTPTKHQVALMDEVLEKEVSLITLVAMR